MDIAALEKLVQSPFLWSILCLLVVSVYYRGKTSEINRLQTQSDEREKSIAKLYDVHKKESNVREERLMKHLEKTTTTLQHIEKGLTKLENKIDGGFKEVWEQIDNIKKGGE